MPKHVYITHIELWNVKGFEHFEAKLGQFNVIRGTNGAGKTSFRMGLEMFFEAGADPRLIRRGADEAKGVITFSNGYTATKVTTKTDAKLTVRNPEGGIMPAPATLIQKLLPRHSFDAQTFLDEMNTEKRTQFILDHLPVSFSIGEINNCLSTRLGQLDLQSVRLLPDGPAKSIEDFDKFFNEVDTARAAINQKIESLRGAERTLEAALPQDDSTDWNAEAERIQRELNNLETDVATAEADLKLVAEKTRTEKRSFYDAEIKDAKAVIAHYLTYAHDFSAGVNSFAESIEPAPARASNLEADAEYLSVNIRAFLKAATDVVRYERELTKALQTINTMEASEVFAVRSAKAEDRARLAGELGTARQKAAQQEQGKGVKIALANTRADLKGEGVRYEHLAAILSSLRRLKAEKMRAVNIEGFDIKWEKAKGARTESATILIDGIPLDDLNRQKSLFICLRLALLAQKDNDSDEILPLVVMETAELVPSKREELEFATREAGMQLVITVPEDGADLSVETSA